MLHIICPVTKKIAPVGFELPLGMDVANSFKNITTDCPVCKGHHTWDGKDAFFVAEIKEDKSRLN